MMTYPFTRMGMHGVASGMHEVHLGAVQVHVFRKACSSAAMRVFHVTDMLAVPSRTLQGECVTRPIVQLLPQGGAAAQFAV